MILGNQLYEIERNEARIAKLPMWAQDIIFGLRSTARAQAEEIKELTAPDPDVTTFVGMRGTDRALQPIGDNPTVTHHYASDNPSAYLTVTFRPDGVEVSNSSGHLSVRPQASNAVRVEPLPW